MKILFCICEGGHDAHFIKRTLLASGKFIKDKSSIEEYREPLRGFFKNCFIKQDWDSIQIGEPQANLLPSTTAKKQDDSQLILIFNIGGDRQIIQTKILLDIIFNFSDPSVRKVLSEGGDNEYSILFFYDADKLGIEGRRSKFCQDFSDCFDLEGFENEKWEIKRGIRLGLFIFTREDSQKGTLEDTLIQLFDATKRNLVTDSYNFLNERSDHREDTIANRARKAKSVLTICGQTESQRAGDSLAIIIKKCEILSDSFNFSDEGKVWSRIVKMTEGAFSRPE